MLRVLVACVLLLAMAVPVSAQSALPLADVSVTSTATEIRPDNPKREAVSCTNTHATVAVRWGDASVTATKGQTLLATRSIEIKARGPIYMISEGATVTVTCTEELR